MTFDEWIASDEGVKRFGMELRDEWIAAAREGWNARAALEPLSEKECDMSREEIKIVDMARFFVPEGAYSIAELEELLALFKAAKERQDAALARSMQEVK